KSAGCSDSCRSPEISPQSHPENPRLHQRQYTHRAILHGFSQSGLNINPSDSAASFSSESHLNRFAAEYENEAQTCCSAPQVLCFHPSADWAQSTKFGSFQFLPPHQVLRSGQEMCVHVFCFRIHLCRNRRYLRRSV